MTKAVDLADLAKNGEPESITVTISSVTTLHHVAVDVEVRDNVHTLVLTRIITGDQIRVPMDPISAATVRKEWDNRIAASRQAEEAE